MLKFQVDAPNKYGSNGMMAPNANATNERPWRPWVRLNLSSGFKPNSSRTSVFKPVLGLSIMRFAILRASFLGTPRVLHRLTLIHLFLLPGILSILRVRSRFGNQILRVAIYRNIFTLHHGAGTCQ